MRSAGVIAVTVVLAGSQWSCVDHKVGKYDVRHAFPTAPVAAVANAACKGDAREVARLVRGGVDPNSRGEQDVTPLFWAITCEEPAGIEALLKAGADPNYRVPGRHTLVYLASGYKDSRILELLLKHGGTPNSRGPTDARSPAWEAIVLGAHGDWTNYDLLLKAGLDIEAADELGSTIADELVALNQWVKMADLLERGYDHDLDRIARYTQLPNQGDPVQNQAKARVKAALEARGVLIPAPFTGA